MQTVILLHQLFFFVYRSIYFCALSSDFQVIKTFLLRDFGAEIFNCLSECET